jgi:hypothetical protein
MELYTVIIKNWQNSIERVIDWAEARGLTVNFKRGFEDQYICEDKLIEINTANSPEHRFYALLHECGHYLIYKTSSNFVRDMPMYKGFCGGSDGRTARSKAYHVSLVAEEIEAWKRGRALARRLDLSVDNKRYDDLMAKCVYSYIKS